MSFPLLILLRCLLGLTVLAGFSPFSLAATPESLNEMTAPLAYEHAFSEFAAGRQGRAEALVERRLAAFPAERRMRFFAATLARSRFDKAEPAIHFAKIVGQDPGDEYARAAVAVFMLDRRQDPEQHFATLSELVEKYPAEPLFLWLLAIESREYDRNELGVASYRRLCEIVKPGGSLVHQTFANVLDGMKLHAESLEHRRLAVELEPAYWSYNGLACTLRSLRQDQEASDAFARSADLNPDYGRNWAQWADCEVALNRLDSALEKYAKAIECGYRVAWVYCDQADVLQRSGQHALAIKALQAGLEENPADKSLLRQLKRLEPAK